MITLFKDTYIALDAHIDVTADRYVFSAEHGYPMLHSPIKSGELLGFSTNLMDDNIAVHQLFETCYSKNVDGGSRVVIYCDTPSMHIVLTHWFKQVLPNITPAAAHELITMYTLKESPTADIPSLAEYTGIYTTIQSQQLIPSIQAISHAASLEFLVSTYVYNKSHQVDLAAALQHESIQSATNDLTAIYRRLSGRYASRPAVQLNLGHSNAVSLVTQDARVLLLGGVASGKIAIQDLTPSQVSDILEVAAVVITEVAEGSSYKLDVPQVDILAAKIGSAQKRAQTEEEVNQLLSKLSLLYRDGSSINFSILETFMRYNSEGRPNDLAPYILR